MASVAETPTRSSPVSSLSSIEGEPTIVRAEKQRRTLFDLLFGDVSEYVPSSTKLMENHPGFYFLWK